MPPKLSSQLPPTLLPHEQLRHVVRVAPLVAIDFVVRNPGNRILLGLRNNEPARGFYFVPGGMILKNERLHDAFARLLKTETNLSATPESARAIGVYEHFYDNNRFGEAGYGTHYVVLGYELKIHDTEPLKRDGQHRELRWWDEAELLAAPTVHQNAKAYFRKPE